MNRLVVAFFLIAIAIIGCSSTGKSKNPITAAQISCDKNQSVDSPVSSDLCQQINDRIQEESGLKDAWVGFDSLGKGHLQISGHFKNEDDVVRVFAIAQSMVGNQWLLPVNPGDIEVETWQECLQAKNAGQACGNWSAEPNTLDKIPPGPVRKRYALVVGVGRFKQNIRPLRFAANDAQSFAAFLTDPALGNFPKANVTLLTDQQASGQAIQTALEDIENRAEKNDLVVVYINSHGAPPNVFGHVNIVTYDTEVMLGDKKADELSSQDIVLQRQALWDSSVPRARLREFFVNMTGKGVKRVVMVLDVSYNGEVWNEFPGLTPSGGEELVKSEQTYATGYSAEQLMQILGAKDQGLAADTELQSLVNPKDKRNDQPLLESKYSRNNKNALEWGQVIISGSNEGEQSLEPDPNNSPDIGHSVFTHYLLENMRHFGGNIQDAYNASAPQVAAKAMEIAQKSQRPLALAMPDQRQWNFALGNGAFEAAGAGDNVPKYMRKHRKTAKVSNSAEITEANKVIEEVKPIKEAALPKAIQTIKRIKYAKMTKSVKVSKFAKDVKSSKAGMMAKPVKETKTSKANTAAKPVKGVKASEANTEAKPVKETKTSKAINADKPAKEAKSAKASTAAKPATETKTTKVSTATKSAKESKPSKEKKTSDHKSKQQ